MVVQIFVILLVYFVPCSVLLYFSSIDGSFEEEKILFITSSR